jgi:hypothetical protein
MTIDPARRQHDVTVARLERRHWITQELTDELQHAAGVPDYHGGRSQVVPLISLPYRIQHRSTRQRIARTSRESHTVVRAEHERTCVRFIEEPLQSLLPLRMPHDHLQ